MGKKMGKMLESEPTDQQKIAYMLSFLAIIVHRKGGKMKIKNLSEMGEQMLNLSMDLDLKGDFVILSTEKGDMRQ